MPSSGRIGGLLRQACSTRPDADTAHKIARTVYHLLKYKTPYQDIGAKAYEQQAQDRKLVHLRKKAAQLGYALTAAIT